MIYEVVFVWKFYEVYLMLCFRDFFNEKKNLFVVVVFNGCLFGWVDFRLKKKMELGYDYYVVGMIYNFGVFKNLGKKVIL